MKKITRPCPWCREENEVSLINLKVYCWSCGHRADVPRVQCDCRKCRVKQVPASVSAGRSKGGAAA